MTMMRTTARRTAPQGIVLTTRRELLPVQLTDDEVRERGRELAQRIQARAAEAAEQKRLKEAMKEALMRLDEQIADLSHRVKSGIEERFVDVQDRLVDGRVETIRMDTGEVLRTRTATDAERQIGLFESGELTPASEARQ